MNATLSGGCCQGIHNRFSRFQSPASFIHVSLRTNVFVPSTFKFLTDQSCDARYGFQNLPKYRHISLFQILAIIDLNAINRVYKFSFLAAHISLIIYLNLPASSMILAPPFRERNQNVICEK